MGSATGDATGLVGAVAAVSGEGGVATRVAIGRVGRDRGRGGGGRADDERWEACARRERVEGGEGRESDGSAGRLEWVYVCEMRARDV